MSPVHPVANLIADLRAWITDWSQTNLNKLQQVHWFLFPSVLSGQKLKFSINPSVSRRTCEVCNPKGRELVVDPYELWSKTWVNWVTLLRSLEFTRAGAFRLTSWSLLGEWDADVG
jgi:hypothetical protein